MRILISTLCLTASLAFAGDEVDSLVQQLKSARDAADPALIQQLGGHQSRDAAIGLVEVYGSMGSLYMKLEVVKALATLDGVDGAEQTALQQLLDIATQAKARELREAAVEALGECERLGKTYLTMLVESAAEDDARERALILHIEQADEGDLQWYEKLYDLEDDKDLAKEEKKRRKKNKKSKRKGKQDAEDSAGESDGIAKTPGRLRALAFAAAAKEMKDAKVLDALKDRYPGVREAALLELSRRESKVALSEASDALGSVSEKPSVRIAAAGIVAKLKGADVVDDFIDIGQKHDSVTPTSLRLTLADLLAEMRDKKVDKKVAKLVGKGKPHQKIFALRAARFIDTPKVGKAIRKMLAGKDVTLAIAAAEVLAERGDEKAIPILLKRAEKAKDFKVITGALHAVSALQRDDAEWQAKLLEYAASEQHDIRNAALIEIGRLGSAGNKELLLERLSHDLWSTRLAALGGLLALNDPTVIGPIIERMEHESGRILHEFADALFRLTGKPFRTSVPSWRAWWKGEGADFEILTPAALEDRIQEEEERRLKQISGSTFFGIRIVSHRVIFIIDVSGSMNENTAGRYLGATGETRMEIAKQELIKAIGSLPREALFNIVTFSSGVDTWEEKVQGSDDDNRERATEFVDHLGAGGGTNLHEALLEAFEDVDVDTIYLLSDGEPSVGAIIDPISIREDVRRWNENRNVVINSIAVGGELQILEWLAEDSGGSHVKYR